MPKKPTTNIMVVDDHPIMRQGLVQLIKDEDGLAVCAEAATAAEALSAAERFSPDMVLIDISLPGRSGLELAKDLKALLPETLILAISMHDETVYAERILKAGGRGYVMKDAGGETIIKAVRAVLDGKIYVSEKIAARILESLASGRSGREQTIDALTDRELEVFQLIGEGLETREIASRLGISFKTVEAHRANIKQKLGRATATELVREAVRWVESQKRP